MLIRCERCSTVYELDETMLAPEGAPVQCTRCENVFVAYPPRAAGRTLVGVPAVQPPPAVAASGGAAAPTPPPQPPPEPPASRPTPGPRAPAADRARGTAPQVYRPTPGPTTAVRGAPVLRKDQVGAFEARLRWSARWKWLAPSIVAGALALALGGWWFLTQRADPEADRLRAEGLARLALDDTQSLDLAIARLDEAAGRQPGRAAVAADAALARLLRAAAHRDEWEDARAADPALATVAEADEPRLAKARALAAAARAALSAVPAGEAATPSVVRARAFAASAGGDRPQVAELAGAARARGEADAWLDVAEAALDLEGPVEARDRAVVRLAGLAAAHPELLRARWLLARGQASLGRTSEALAALEAVLAANPRHEGARRLRERLTAPPPAPATPGNGATPDGNAVATPEPPPRRRVRAEAVPAAIPEETILPSTDVRPILEEAPGERPEPSVVPTPPRAEPPATSGDVSPPP